MNLFANLPHDTHEFVMTIASEGSTDVWSIQSGRYDYFIETVHDCSDRELIDAVITGLKSEIALVMREEIDGGVY